MVNILEDPFFLAVFAAVVAPLFVLTIVWLVRYFFRASRTLDKLDVFVLPHFMPPPPGHEDVSIPARVEDLTRETRRVRQELRDHMRTEEEQQRVAALTEGRKVTLLRKVARAVGLDPDE